MFLFETFSTHNKEDGAHVFLKSTTLNLPVQKQPTSL